LLFGPRKKGFAKEVELTDFSQEVNEDKLKEEEEKMDLMDYLDQLDEEESPLTSEELETEEAVEEEKSETELLADFIRLRSQAAHLTAKSSLEKEEPELEQLLEDLKNDEKCKDITSIRGEKDIYFYSKDFMSDNYAMIAALVEDNNLPRTIAEMVRWNCKTYPCATPLYYFKNSPYFYTDAQIERALMRIRQEEEYSDIQELTTGNNVRYLYSTLHMTEKYARALAEGVEYGEYGYRRSN